MLIAAWSAAYFAIVTVHEVGCYLAGLVIGVPRRDVRIRLLCFPQYVALRDGHVSDFTRLGHGLRNRTDCIAVLHLLPSLTHTFDRFPWVAVAGRTTGPTYTTAVLPHRRLDLWSDRIDCSIPVSRIKGSARIGEPAVAGQTCAGHRAEAPA
jgi:hypothetical protein